MELRDRMASWRSGFGFQASQIIHFRTRVVSLEELHRALFVSVSEIKEDPFREKFMYLCLLHKCK